MPAKNPSSIHYQQALEALDPWISMQVMEGNVPVLAIAAQTDDGTIFHRVYTREGKVFSPEKNEAPLFPIGSLSKTLTATAIFKLAEEKKLELNDPFLKFFPDVAVPGNSPLRQVTLLHLMRHQGQMAAMQVKGWEEESPDQKEMLSCLAQENPNAPGKDLEEFNYSNLGVALLGLVVERASGTPYGDYATENILRPLGLADTFPEIAQMPSAARARILKGHSLDEKREPVELTRADQKAFNPARGYASYPRDIARFCHALLTGKVLSPAHTKMLHEAYIWFGEGEKDLRYSPGIMHSWLPPARDEWSLGHQGVAGGSVSFVGWNATTNMTISMMMNAVKLPADAQHEFEGHTYLAPFALPLFRRLKTIAEEAQQNEGFQKLIFPPALARLRRPSIKPGFNPEAPFND